MFRFSDVCTIVRALIGGTKYDLVGIVLEIWMSYSFRYFFWLPVFRVMNDFGKGDSGVRLDSMLLELKKKVQRRNRVLHIPGFIICLNDCTWQMV